jgi:hypothetical protein
MARQGATGKPIHITAKPLNYRGKQPKPVSSWSHKTHNRQV